MIHLRDVQFVAASCPPGAGRNAIDPRFVSLFSTFNITFPSDNVIDHIYSSILTFVLGYFPRPYVFRCVWNDCGLVCFFPLFLFFFSLLCLIACVLVCLLVLWND